MRRLGADDDRRRGRRVLLVAHLAHAHVVPRLVRRLERLLELAEPLSIEAESIGRLVETRALLQRDDAVFDDFGENFLVVNFELPEPEVAGELALLERSFVLEREFFRRHGFSPRDPEPRSIAGRRAGIKGPAR